MDPLSVAASIVGVLGAAAQVSSVLCKFIQNTRGAPKLAQIVLTDVNGLSVVLGQLQSSLAGTITASKSGASLILVEQVIVTLTQCVTTFSELEEVLGTAKMESEFSILDRVKWALKESKIADIQKRLESNKITLTLMLTILQCKTATEAESDVNRLCILVEQVLAQNQVLGLRLRSIDEDNIAQNRPSATDDRISDAPSSRTVTPPLETSVETKAQVSKKPLGFAFEEDLLASRVYRRPLFSSSGESLVTSAARSTASSILSSLSLTDVSNISILAVPVYAHEISNSARYTFGDFMPEATIVQSDKPSASRSENNSKPGKWGSFTAAVRRQRPQRPPSMPIVPKEEPRILGVMLEESIRYANVAISLLNANGETYVYGYIPIFVAKIGVFLKEKATDVEDIFAVSGSPIRLQQLEAIFDRPPRYGKGHDWTGFTVHDGANIFLRYLLRMPESIIPPSQYGGFLLPPEKLRRDITFSVVKFQQLITELPPLRRQLLLYMLDILAVFCSKSEINKMTLQRMAAIFQPAILSPVRVGEQFIEEEGSRQHSRDVMVFLIENQDNFLVGLD